MTILSSVMKLSFAILTMFAVSCISVERALAVGGSWTTKASMPTARSIVAAVTIDNKIYVMGGENGSEPLGVNEDGCMHASKKQEKE